MAVKWKELNNQCNFSVKECMITSSNGNFFCVTGPLCREFACEFPSQRPVTWSFDVFFDLCLNKRRSIQSWGWWFEIHCGHYDVNVMWVLLTWPVCRSSPPPLPGICTAPIWVSNLTPWDGNRYHRPQWSPLPEEKKYKEL